MSRLEEAMALQLEAAGLPFEREYRAVPGRRFRLDFAWPEQRVGLEVEGGLFVQRRTGKRGIGHTSTAALLRDCEKHSELAVAGWRLIRATAPTVRNGQALRWVQDALGKEG